MKILSYILVFLAVTVVVLIITEQVFRTQDLKILQKEATFVQIEGKKVQYKKSGKGKCTVVFESGLGSDLSIWRSVQDSVSKNAVTLSYNRSGITLSDPSDEPISNSGVSERLSALLAATGCPKPYIVVGHSMGGIYLRHFIDANRKDVAGIVFADAAHPLQLKKSSPELLKSLAVPPDWLVKFLMKTGIYRMMFSLMSLPAEVPVAHPINVQQKKYFYLSYPGTMHEAASDQVNFADAERYTSYGNIPLAVITGTSAIRTEGFRDEGVKKEYMTLVSTLHRDLLTLSTDSWLVKARKSGHVIQATEPEIITEQIRLVMKKSGF